MTKNELSSVALEEGKGILRLAPTWVPRSFCRPGKRIKLHPGDYYACGALRGAIDERWLSSATQADNGPGTPEDEGLSYIVLNNGERVLLRDAVSELKGGLIGDDLWSKYGRWAMFSKFFDNLGPLPHHIHHRDHHAKLVGMSGKPEMYFFPSQMNNHPGEFALTFFGLNPGVSKERLREALARFSEGDNQLLTLSRAYKLALDTGWDVPPGVLHAPGSLCTYEPQFASDVLAMYQSVLLGGHVVPQELLWKNCPPDMLGNFDYLVDVLDWETNIDPDFEKSRFMLPMSVNASGVEDGYHEEWICYKCDIVSAKRLTVLPGQEVTIKDAAAYGMILVQGHGQMGMWDIETPTLIRYGELAYDEFFVSESAARAGVVINNRSRTEPLVMLKHFSENSDLADAFRGSQVL